MTSIPILGRKWNPSVGNPLSFLPPAYTPDNCQHHHTPPLSSHRIIIILCIVKGRRIPPALDLINLTSSQKLYWLFSYSCAHGVAKSPTGLSHFERLSLSLQGRRWCIGMFLKFRTFKGFNLAGPALRKMGWLLYTGKMRDCTPPVYPPIPDNLISVPWHRSTGLKDRSSVIGLKITILLILFSHMTSMSY